MCGIAGSSNLKTAFNLYEKNLERGAYSSGLLCVRDFKDPLIIKTKGIFDYNNLINKFNITPTECSYFLFHSRAPTNSVNTVWSENNTHPFKWEYFYVAHNGIITNFKDLEESKGLEVDSSIIPKMLYQQPIIKYTYSKLEGLLTSWIYNNNNQSINIVKAGSSLWMSEDSFSSVSFEGSKQIEEDGMIFELINQKFIYKDSFGYSNPYFI